MYTPTPTTHAHYRTTTRIQQSPHTHYYVPATTIIPNYPLVIHRAVQKDANNMLHYGDHWIVTHSPSGLRLLKCRTRHIAESFLVQLQRISTSDFQTINDVLHENASNPQFRELLLMMRYA